MKRLFTISAAILVIAFAANAKAGSPDTAQDAVSPHILIPAPAEIQESAGTFTVPSHITYSIQAPRAMDCSMVTGLAEGKALGMKKVSGSGVIRIEIGTSVIKKIADKRSWTDFARRDGYRLSIDRKGIRIEALNPRGAFYALESLWQMLQKGSELACCSIIDAPRYNYRGFMLDASTTFYSKDFIFKQLDAMARLKLNAFHFHAIDWTGWRIEIKKYPKLQSVGAWRLGELDWTPLRRYVPEDDPDAYGGYYTQEDVRDIVAYAASLGIDVIPEVEMPGHSKELVTAYPEMACLSEPDANGERHPIYHRDLCVGSKMTIPFFKDVLDEIMDLFPSEFIHIGGDEAKMVNWHTCPRCQALMKEKGMEDVSDLQRYMTNEIVDYLVSKGRTAMLWDEDSNDNLNHGVVGMKWHGRPKLPSGQDEMVYAYHADSYVCYPQDAPLYEPEFYANYLPLSRMYAYEPVPEGTPKEVVDKVRGLESCLWSGNIFAGTPEKAEYLMYPRVFATAEISWTPRGEKDYDGFRERSLGLLDTFHRLGYNSFDLENEVGPRPESRLVQEHKAKGKKVTYNEPYGMLPDLIYPTPPALPTNDESLTDGLRGDWNGDDGRWQAFYGEVDVVIDLESIEDIHSVSADFLCADEYAVTLPRHAEVSFSADGVSFGAPTILWCPVRPSKKTYAIATLHTEFESPQKARYIHFRTVRNKKIDEVRDPVLQLDEIIVR